MTELSELVFVLFIFSIQNMSGQDFVCVLQRLGFENLNEITGLSFAWMFDYDQLWPFLDWFCADLQATNVLKSSDLEL